MDDNKMTVINDAGEEIEVEILLTFDYEETGKQYVMFFDPADPDTVFAASYTEDSELEMVESEEEMAICEEVLNSFDAGDL